MSIAVECPSCGHTFEPHVKARRILDLEHLGDVADIYRNNLHTGKPTAMVQLHFQCCHRTAARWVAHAREAGLITTEPQPGGRRVGWTHKAAREAGQ